jgi:hypothetical protein
MNLKTIVFLVTLTILGWLSANAEYKSLVVNLNSGEKTTVNFGFYLEASFSDSEMLFKSTDVDIAIPRADIKDFYFSEDLSVNKSTADFGISFSQEAISLSNLPNASRISIYTPAGVQLLSTSASGNYDIPTNKLSKGVNIIKINNLTYKVNIK